MITTKLETTERKQEIKTKQQAVKAKKIVKKLGKNAQIVEEDGKKYLVTKKHAKKVALKTYKD